MLTEALAPVLRDLRDTGAPVPMVEDRAWTGDPAAPSAMLGSPDGSGRGVFVHRGIPAVEAVATVADQVQEWAVEELASAGRSNWPPCPRRPATHPLGAVARAAAAVWICPVDGAVIAPVGELAALRRSPTGPGSARST